MIELKKFLSNVVLLTEGEMEIILSLFSEMSLRKDEYFAKNGEYSTKLAFLTKGVMRAFFRNEGGKEYNKTFFTKANFVAAYSSLITKQKNLINIQCLTDCTMLFADFRKITELYDDYPMFERLSRKIAESKFAIKEKREIELVTLDAIQRYAIFLKEHAGLENIIPQYHIASYLGITPTQLSRIRAKS